MSRLNRRFHYPKSKLGRYKRRKKIKRVLKDLAILFVLLVIGLAIVSSLIL